MVSRPGRMRDLEKRLERATEGGDQEERQKGQLAS